MIKKISALCLVLCPLAWPIATIGELDRASLFNFIVMSDNKGNSPLDDSHMEKCDRWAHDAKSEFIIGLGDHVKKGTPNTFIDYMKNTANTLWNAKFYPNVADGENEYWGSGQGDWGSGKPIFDAVRLADRANVELRSNKVEYYAKVSVKGFTVHLIQLHFADSPGPDLAFRENSRQYMMDKLASITKGPKDIIMVMAHSQNGDFLSVLSNTQRAALLAKADFLMSATTHTYKRLTYSGFERSGTLSLNTGSVGNSGSENGFVQIHVLENPVRYVLQYQSTNGGSRQLRGAGKSYVLENGTIKDVNWNGISIPSTKANAPVLAMEAVNAGFSKHGDIMEFKVLAVEATKIDLSVIDCLGVRQGNVFTGRIPDGSSTLAWSSPGRKPGIYYLHGFAGDMPFSKAFLLMK